MSSKTSIFNPEDEEIYQTIVLLLKNVIHRRKKIPKKILEINREEIARKVKNLEEAKCEVKDEFAKQEIFHLSEEVNKNVTQLSNENPNPCSIFDKLREEQKKQQEIEEFVQTLKEESNDLEMEE